MKVVILWEVKIAFSFNFNIIKYCLIVRNKGKYDFLIVLTSYRLTLRFKLTLWCVMSHLWDRNSFKWQLNYENLQDLIKLCDIKSHSDKTQSHNRITVMKTVETVVFWGLPVNMENVLNGAEKRACDEHRFWMMDGAVLHMQIPCRSADEAFIDAAWLIKASLLAGENHATAQWTSQHGKLHTLFHAEMHHSLT